MERNGLPLPVDYAFDGPMLGPPGLPGATMPIHQIEDGHPDWVSFPGFWGEGDYLQLPRPIGLIRIGTSPVGPAYHAVWLDPLATLATWPEG